MSNYALSSHAAGSNKTVMIAGLMANTISASFALSRDIEFMSFEGTTTIIKRGAMSTKSSLLIISEASECDLTSALSNLYMALSSDYSPIDELENLLLANRYALYEN